MHGVWSDTSLEATSSSKGSHFGAENRLADRMTNRCKKPMKTVVKKDKGKKALAGCGLGYGELDVRPHNSSWMRMEYPTWEFRTLMKDGEVALLPFSLAAE